MEVRNEILEATDSRLGWLSVIVILHPFIQPTNLNRAKGTPVKRLSELLPPQETPPRGRWRTEQPADAPK